jgi:hypothetical protein
LVPVKLNPVVGRFPATIGLVLSIVKVIPVEFPNASRTRKVYHDATVIGVQLTYDVPLSVAPEILKS